MLDQPFYSVYQRYARFYNLYFGKLMNPGRAKAIELAELKEGDKILEVGVGTGLSLPFYPPYVEVTGIDLAPLMLKRAQKLVEKENFKYVKELKVMDAEHMSFPDDSFDCVMAMHVSTVVGHPRQFVQEMKRVCKSGGKILIVNYFHDPQTPMGRISRFLTPYAKYIGFRPDLTLEDFLQQTGLSIEKRCSVNIFNIHNILLISNQKK